MVPPSKKCELWQGMSFLLGSGHLQMSYIETIRQMSPSSSRPMGVLSIPGKDPSMPASGVPGNIQFLALNGRHWLKNEEDGV